MKQSELIAYLIHTSKQLNIKAEEILDLQNDTLKKRPHEKAWNTYEVFEHLNYYIDLYNEQFEISLKKSMPLKTDQAIKRGYWGNKFIEMMRPRKDKIKKMNTFKSKNPLGKNLGKACISHFIESNTNTIKLLEQAKTQNISKVKCKLAIPILKLQLSDAFQFIIAHNERHFKQIEKNLNQ